MPAVLINSGDIDPRRAQQAIAPYEIDPEAPMPTTV